MAYSPTGRPRNATMDNHFPSDIIGYKPAVVELYVEKCGEVWRHRYQCRCGNLFLAMKGNIVRGLRGFNGAGTCGCAGKEMTDSRRHTTTSFITAATKIHGKRYDYSSSVYPQHNKIKLSIICREHGVFLTKPNLHLSGRGCPKCRLYKGWTHDAWVNSCGDKNVRFYVLQCKDENESFLKVGITSQTVRQRYSGAENHIPYEWEEVIETYADPSFVWNTENSLLEAFKTSRYVPQQKFPGHTECLLGEILPDILQFLSIDCKQMDFVHQLRIAKIQELITQSA